MIESQVGNLIISSVPTQYAMDQMIVYVMSIVKKAPRQTLEQKFQSLPTTLFKNIEAEKGRKIVNDLTKMGVISKFVEPGAVTETASVSYEDEEAIDTVGKLLQELLYRARPSVEGAAHRAKSALEKYQTNIKETIKEFKGKRI